MINTVDNVVKENALYQLYNLVIKLAEFTSELWEWLGKTREISFLGFTIIEFNILGVIGGVGLLALITWWIIRG